MRDIFEIQCDRVTIKTAIPIKTLTDLRIDQRENEHVRIMIRGIIQDDGQAYCKTTNWIDESIVVLDRWKTDRVLFNGKIDQLLYKDYDKMLSVEIRGISSSVRLDRDKRKRSFQNVKMTYKQVIDQVMKGYTEANVIWRAGANEEIKDPLIQYEETDWEFLIRLCSHFHDVLIADAKTGKADLFFGIGKGDRKEPVKIEVLEEGFSDVYYTNGCFEDGSARSRTLYLVITTEDHLQIGDLLLYEGRRYQVYRRKILLRKGEIVFYYRLGTEGIYHQKKKYNEALVGAQLEGRIKKVEGENVYLQFDIDKDPCSAMPWPWMPEINNIGYCMPEVGEKAVLTFPTQEERDGISILSLRGEGSKAACLNTQERGLATKQHKKIKLYPKEITLEGDKGAVISSLSDEDGIKIESDKTLSITASGKVEIAGKRVFGEAPLEITCLTERSNIEVCRDFNFYAPSGVKIKGEDQSGDKVKKYAPGSEDEKADHWRLSFAGLAAIPAFDLSKGEAESIVDMAVCGAIPRIAEGAAVVALKEVMDGKAEADTSFPDALQSMEAYSVKGGYRIPSDR